MIQTEAAHPHGAEGALFRILHLTRGKLVALNRDNGLILVIVDHIFYRCSLMEAVRTRPMAVHIEQIAMSEQQRADGTGNEIIMVESLIHIFRASVSLIHSIVAAQENYFLAVRVDLLQLVFQPGQGIRMEADALRVPDLIGIGGQRQKVHAPDFIMVTKQIFLPGVLAHDFKTLAVGKRAGCLIHRAGIIKFKGIVGAVLAGAVGSRLTLGKIVVAGTVEHLAVLSQSGVFLHGSFLIAEIVCVRQGVGAVEPAGVIAHIVAAHHHHIDLTFGRKQCINGQRGRFSQHIRRLQHGKAVVHIRKAKGCQNRFCLRIFLTFDFGIHTLPSYYLLFYWFKYTV